MESDNSYDKSLLSLSNTTLELLNPRTLKSECILKFEHGNIPNTIVWLDDIKLTIDLDDSQSHVLVLRAVLSNGEKIRLNLYGTNVIQPEVRAKGVKYFVNLYVGPTGNLSFLRAFYIK